MSEVTQFTDEQIRLVKYYATRVPPTNIDVRIEALVKDLASWLWVSAKRC
jgi:hypothetical protein